MPCPDEDVLSATPKVLRSSATMSSTASSSAFFVFEGIDGSGKSTVSRLFAKKLSERGLKVEWTAEPSSSWIGDQVRRANKEASSDFAETLLYIADRAEHTEQIARWLADGRTVVCDRYVGSTLAYQSVTLRPHLGARALDWLKAVNEPLVIKPSFTFLLRIEPEVAMERLTGRKDREKFEKLEFLQRVAAVYDSLAKEDRTYIVIDASRPLEEVVEAAWAWALAMMV